MSLLNQDKLSYCRDTHIGADYAVHVQGYSRSLMVLVPVKNPYLTSH